MPLIIVAVAVAAAAGVALVMYGIVSRNEFVAATDISRNARVTYRTLADVREQLRRRFEPTGTPVWIAANQNANPLAADLASADLQLRPYEFRLVQLAVALAFVIVAFLRFGVSIAVPVLGVIGYVLPALYLRNRRGRRLQTFEAGLPRAMELIANSIKAGQSIAQSLSSVTDNAGPPLNEEFGLARREIELGASVDSALSNMVKRMGSTDLRLVVMVITIQHSVGGDLPAIGREGDSNDSTPLEAAQHHARNGIPELDVPTTREHLPAVRRESNRPYGALSHERMHHHA